MTEFNVTVATNGFIVEDDGYVTVYQWEDPNLPIEMYENILGELIDSINSCSTIKFKVKVDVIPIE